MADVAERRRSEWDGRERILKVPQLYTGTGANDQTITLQSPSALPWVRITVFDTTNDRWGTSLQQVTSLTGEALGFTFVQSSGLITFGDGTDGYAPESATSNVLVEYHPLDGGSITTTTAYQWSGDDGAITAEAPDTDTAIDISGAKSISIQLKTCNVAAGVSTFDVDVMTSPDGSTYDDTAYVSPFSGIAEGKEVTRSITPGPYYMKLRLTVNTTNPATGENTLAKVVVVK